MKKQILVIIKLLFLLLVTLPVWTVKAMAETGVTGVTGNYPSHQSVAGNESPPLSRLDPIANLALKKSASYNEADQTVDIQMEAHATGKIVTSKNQADVVFVLDDSGSMGSGGRLTALKASVNSFVDSMIADQGELNASGAGKYHTIQAITYNTNATSFNRIYRTDNAKDMTDFRTRVAKISANGETYPDRGLKLAEDMVKKNILNTSRNPNQVVLLFTDGEPSSQTVAANSVNIAKRLKNDMSAVIYSVGVQIKADPSKTDYTDLGNSMLNGISTNYPNATVPGAYPTLNLGKRSTNGDFYLTTKNLAELKEIFKEIASQIGDKIEPILIREVLDDGLVMPTKADGTPDLSSVKVYQAWEYSPSLTPINGLTMTYDPKTKTLDVPKNKLEPIILDQLGNPSQDTKNNKLIIRLKAKVDPDFMGGNQVVTSKVNSGGYITNANEQETHSQMFVNPSVNIPIGVKMIKLKNQKTYIGNQSNLSDFFTNAAIFNGINNKYVNTELTVEKTNKDLMTATILAGQTFADSPFAELKNENNDVDYNLTFKLNPSLPSAAGQVGVAPIAESKPASIYLFKPEINAQERKIYLTNQLQVDNKLPTLVKWDHPQAASLASLAFTGTEPTLGSATYSDTSGLTAEKTTAKVTSIVLSNQKTVTQDVAFDLYVFRPELLSDNATIKLGESTKLSERHIGTTWKNSQTTAADLEGKEPTLVLNPTKVGSKVPESATVSPTENTDYYWQIEANGKKIDGETKFSNNSYGASKQPTDAHFSIYVMSRVVVKHVYDYGGDVQPEETIEGLVGSEYTLDPLDLAPVHELLKVEGGTLNSADKVVGEFENKPKTITFIYRYADVNLTVKYMLEDGVTPVIDIATNKAVPDRKEKLRIGSVLTATSYKKELEGYTNTEVVNPSGNQVPDKDFTIVFKYKGELSLMKVPNDIDFGSNNNLITLGTKVLRPTAPVSVEIMDTRQSTTDWHLDLHLFDEFKTKDGDAFKGEVHFKDKQNNDVLITKNKKPIEVREVEKLGKFSQTWNEKNEGLYLVQYPGNQKASYETKLVWTLSDAP